MILFRFKWLRKGLPVGLILLLLTLAACSNEPTPLEVVEFELLPTETALPQGVVPVAPPVAGLPIDASNTVALIEVLPAAPTVVLLGKSQLTAITRNAQGEELTGRGVAWSSDNQQIITVDAANGTVTGVAVGTANITASSEGIAVSTVVSVALVPVASVTILQNNQSVVEDETLTLTASPRDAANTALTGRSIIWTSNSPDIATVDQASGSVKGILAGQVVITATSGNKQDTTSVTVTHGNVNTIQVSPGSFSIVEGSTAQGGTSRTLTATLKDAKGHTIPGKVSWSSESQAVAAVSQSGVVAGIGTGSTNIVAASGGKTRKVSVSVNHGPVSTVSVTVPGSNSIIEGATKTLTAVLKDAKGHTISGSTLSSAIFSGGLITSAPITKGLITGGLTTGGLTTTGTVTGGTITKGTTTSSNATWSSSNTGRATVSSSGVVTGVAAGSVTITAKSGNVSGTATLTIVHGSPNSVTISGGSSIVEGSSATYSATVKDVKGHTLSGQSVVWGSSDTNIALVNNPGVGKVNAVTAGAVTISATSSNNKVGTKSVKINHGAVSSVTLPPIITVFRGVAISLTATLKDAKGHAVSGSITWSISGANTIAVSPTVSPAGGNKVTIIGLFPGQSELTATSNGKSAKVSVLVL